MTIILFVTVIFSGVKAPVYDLSFNSVVSCESYKKRQGFTSNSSFKYTCEGIKK